MEIANLVIKVVLILCGFGTIIYGYKRYMDHLEMLANMADPQDIIEANRLKLDFGTNADNTTKLLEFIDRMIEIKFLHFIRAHLAMPKTLRYNVMWMDDDMKEVAEDVYRSLNKEVFLRLKDKNSLITSDYLHHYIVMRVSITFYTFLSKVPRAPKYESMRSTGEGFINNILKQD